VKEWSDAGTVLFVTAFTDAGEAVALFPGFEILHHREGPGPEHRHGDGPVQRHELVELVLRR
jgi:hypothetical protein